VSSRRGHSWCSCLVLGPVAHQLCKEASLGSVHPMVKRFDGRLLVFSRIRSLSLSLLQMRDREGSFVVRRCVLSCLGRRKQDSNGWKTTNLPSIFHVFHANV